MKIKWWVGVKANVYTDHEVFKAKQSPNEKSHSQYKYVIGPFNTQLKAKEHAATHKNVDGMFHPGPAGWTR